MQGCFLIADALMLRTVCVIREVKESVIDTSYSAARND